MAMWSETAREMKEYMGNWSLGEQNPEGEPILETALAHELLVVANTVFQKMTNIL